MGIVESSITETSPAKHSISEETDEDTVHPKLQKFVTDECYQEKTDDIAVACDTKSEHVVYPVKGTSLGYENVNDPVQVLSDRIADIRNHHHVPTDDSGELKLLLEILKKNDGSIQNSLTTGNVSTTETAYGVQSETEDPEELKLFIKMLNQGHIPISNQLKSIELEPSQSSLSSNGDNAERGGSPRDLKVEEDIRTDIFMTENNKSVETKDNQLEQVES